MTLIVLGEAEQEFAESIAYYESKEPGLGWRFRNDVREAVDGILRYPELPRLRPKGYRRNASATRSIRERLTVALSRLSSAVCLKRQRIFTHVASVN
jgi:hypothetical protein